MVLLMMNSLEVTYTLSQSGRYLSRKRSEHIDRTLSRIPTSSFQNQLLERRYSQMVLLQTFICSYRKASSVFPCQFRDSSVKQVKNTKQGCMDI